MIHRSISQSVKRKDCFASRLSDIERYVSEIKAWMKCNMLKMNDDKHCRVRCVQIKDIEQSIQVSSTEVDISSKMRNLGFIFDQALSMQSHVNSVAKSFYYLRNIARIRRILLGE